LALCFTKKAKTIKINITIAKVCASTFKEKISKYANIKPVIKRNGISKIAKECEKQEWFWGLSSGNIEHPIIYI
jgi:hypothetical protein